MKEFIKFVVMFASISAIMYWFTRPIVIEAAPAAVQAPAISYFDVWLITNGFAVKMAFVGLAAFSGIVTICTTVLFFSIFNTSDAMDREKFIRFKPVWITVVICFIIFLLIAVSIPLSRDAKAIATLPKVSGSPVIVDKLSPETREMYESSRKYIEESTAGLSDLERDTKRGR